MNQLKRKKVLLKRRQGSKTKRNETKNRKKCSLIGFHPDIVRLFCLINKKKKRKKKMIKFVFLFCHQLLQTIREHTQIVSKNDSGNNTFG